MSRPSNRQWKQRPYLLAAVPLLLLLALAVAFSATRGASAAITDPASHSAIRPTALRTPITANGMGQGTTTATATTTCQPTWSIVTHPVPGNGNSRFAAIAAIAANDVWAVGSYGAANNYDATVAEHWDGISWSLVTTPNVPPYGSVLASVAAIAANDIWAVGWYQSGGADLQTLTMHWDGTQWTIVNSPSVGANSELRAVGAASTNDVWAVGYSGTDPYQTLTEHWNGSTWSVVPSPNVGTGSNQLNGVSAASATDAWAVGSSVSAGGADQTLILHFDGGTWAVENSPNVGTDNNFLEGVVAVSANDVWAVGYHSDNGGSGTLTVHLTSPEQWTLVPSVDPSTNNVLNSVGATEPNDVWAVGYYYGTVTGTLTEHWNGTSWVQVPSPSMGGGANSLVSVAPISPTNVWAVGWYFSSGVFRTLIERYASPCSPTTTSTPTAIGPTTTTTTTAIPTTTASATVPATNTGTATSIATSTAIQTGTRTPEATPTATPPTATSTTTMTPCSMNFSDVHESDYFYQPVLYLYCRGVISGYADSTFRPYNNTTRGQLSKIIVLAEGWEIDTSGGPHFYDVPTSSPFYSYVETAYNHSVISGYADGTFRWGNNVTRGQLSKIVVSAEGWTVDTSGGPHFTDVSTSHPFYGYVETAYRHSIISGYADGTFRPGNNATRGQISRIVYLALTSP